jgi:hypothetical protein
VPEIDSDILPGVAQDGVLILDLVQADGENLKVISEGKKMISCHCRHFPSDDGHLLN